MSTQITFNQIQFEYLPLSGPNKKKNTLPSDTEYLYKYTKFTGEIRDNKYANVYFHKYVFESNLLNSDFLKSQS